MKELEKVLRELELRQLEAAAEESRAKSQARKLAGTDRGLDWRERQHRACGRAEAYMMAKEIVTQAMRVEADPKLHPFGYSDWMRDPPKELEAFSSGAKAEPK